MTKKSNDTKGRGCGIFPLIFRGWAKIYCDWHDDAYTEGSPQQKAGISRERVDKNFEDQLNEGAKKGTFKWGKRQMAAVMDWIVDLPFVARWYEGKKESDKKRDNS